MLFDVKSSKSTFWGLSAKEVIYHIERGNLPLNCKIFHPMKQRWEDIEKNHSIAQELSKKLIDKPLSYNYESMFYHWSLKNFLSHQGYFTLMDVIEKLQKNEVAKSSLINHPTLRKWTSLDSIEIFSDNSIRALYKLKGLDQFFVDRKKPRPDV